MAAFNENIKIPCQVRFTRPRLWLAVKPLVVILDPDSRWQAPLRKWLVRITGAQVRIGDGPWKTLL